MCIKLSTDRTVMDDKYDGSHGIIKLSKNFYVTQKTKLSQP